MRAESSGGPELAQDLARDLAVVEGDRAVAELLPLLMALARDHDDVALPSELERAGDRPRPVRFDLGFSVHARKDLLDDRERILAARVVGRDEDGICGLARRPPHQRALGTVTVAAAAE